MSEPKRAPPSPPASSAKRARGAPPDGPLSALPLDLITCIVAFAPLRARLRTLSLVCKRWRTAVLRSVTHLRLVDDPDDDTGPILPHANAALGLFPHLASLKLVCDFGPCALAPPTTLTALTLLARPLWSNTVPAPPAWLSAHFPHLSFFTLRDSTERPLRRALLLDFISRHNTSLTRLTADTWSAVSASPNARVVVCLPEWNGDVTPVPLPQLRTVTLTTDSRAVRRKVASILGAYPGLKELHLSLTDMNDLEPHALSALLAALCRLGVRQGLRLLVGPRIPRSLARPRLAELGWIELRDYACY